MKVKVLFAALASLVLASCTNNELLLDETKKGQEIRFSVAPQTAQTRADVTDGNTGEHGVGEAYSGKLKIWAWAHTESGQTGGKYNDDPIIKGDIYDASLKRFISQMNYYYPKSGADVTFFAVPIEVIKDQVTSGDAYYFEKPEIEVKNEVEYLNAKFQTPNTFDHHEKDLMTSEFVTKNSGTVAFVLRHLFAKVGIRVQQSEILQSGVGRHIVTIKSLVLGNLSKKGYVNIGEDWTAINDGVDQQWDDETDEGNTWAVINTNAPKALAVYDDSKQLYVASNFETTKSHFVLPQSLNNNQTISINYEIVTKFDNGQPDDIKEYSFTDKLQNVFPTIDHWAMNKSITYIIVINPYQNIDNTRITFDVDVERWGNISSQGNLDHSAIVNN